MHETVRCWYIDARLTHTAVYILPLVDMRVLSKLITYLLPLRELLVGLLLGLGLLLGDALLDEGWAHALAVAPLLSLLALERRHDLVKVQLLEPVADRPTAMQCEQMPMCLKPLQLQSNWPGFMGQVGHSRQPAI